ncbi:MAG: glutathione-regulated potassium-efflux system protein KefC [Bdellovibrio sp. 28-41-41]|nr:MAG: glutathione-regulated potassium-efflux system protein KefC [Bdellovibrio sp. 28-41-41]
MNHSNDFLHLIVFLVSAVICVPLCKKIGLGPILGYLIAGVIIGPHGIKLISNVQETMHLSEFGVVLFMFIIGLELNPKKLWSLRMPIFGMGTAQVAINTLVFTGISYAVGLSIPASILVGMAFSLSSTAMGLQLLNERNAMSTVTGTANFSILLFQDIAVIAMLSVLPLLSDGKSADSSDIKLLNILKTVVIIVAVLIAGRLLLRPLLRFIAGIHLREIFTAFSLLLVMSMAYLMQSLDISMALGAFLAGVLLADSEYRHALETDIEPFKGLLLGLFFISVGMSVNLSVILEQPLLILSCVFGAFVVKISVHFAIGHFFNLPKSQLTFFSLVIAQVGEFAFVLLGAAATLNIFDATTNEILITIVALTLLATPLLVFLYDKLIAPMIEKRDEIEPDIIEEQENPVIIAGFGRFGQIIGRLLYANKIPTTVLDHEPDQIELLRRFGFKIYYGDATRLDLLEAAGIQKAKILVVAIDSAEENLKLVKLAKEHFPHLKIYARARNVQHVYDLIDQDIEGIERETFEASLKMGIDVMRGLGWSGYESVKRGQIFRRHNLEVIKDMHSKRKNEKEFLAKARQAREDLERMFEEENQLRTQPGSGWDS